MSETLKSAVPDHETVHRKMVERIVADLQPVGRLWPLSLRLAAWATVELALLLFVLRNTHRSDLALQLGNPSYLLTVGGFLLAGVLGASLALRSAIPGREPRVAETGLLIVLVFASTLLVLHQPLREDVLVATFVKAGFPCAIGTFMLAAIPWLALLWAVGRGAPLSAGFGGGLIGAGAFLSSFALMRLNCPVDEGTHLLVWHLLPALGGIVLSACVGALVFKRRSHSHRARAR